MNTPPILEIRAEPVREVSAALHQGRCVAILAPEVSGSSGVLHLVSDELGRPGSPYVVANLTLPKGSVLPVDDFFRSLLRHLIRRLRTAAPELDVRHIMGELYGDGGQSLLPDSQSAALQFEEVLAVIVDEILVPKGQKLILVADHLGRVSADHLREFGNIVHRLWEELDGNLVLLTAGSEMLYSLCRRGSGDGYFSAFHIAHRVELEDLSPDAVTALVRRRDDEGKLGLSARGILTALVERIVEMTDGHPHFADRMVRLAAEHQNNELALMSDEDIFRIVAADDDHLEVCRQRVLGAPGSERALMLERLAVAVAGPHLSALDRDKAIETLRWLGLITIRDGHWRPRNRLYELFIHWLLQSGTHVQRTPTAPTLDDGPADLAGSRTVDLFDNRYQLVRQISTGSFGTIFEAEDLLLRTTVALKRLHPHLSTDKVSERFRREVLIARRLTHPNIVRVHDIGKFDGSLYYSMEYVSGGNLADQFQGHRGPNRAERLLPLLAQLCDGLQALHDAGIIHRDLKPENALLDSEKQIKLADFGIAVALDMARLTGVGAVGTPLYMSPEQATGEELTLASDIYALGVLLYEVYEGKPPFESSNIRKIMAMQANDPPPPMAADNVPTSMVAMITSALDKDPSRRPRSATEVARGIRDAINAP